MAAGCLTVLGWEDGLALYCSDEYPFLYCRCFLFVLGFLSFVCMLIPFFLGYPSLHRLCQDCALIFILVWVQCPCLAAVPTELNLFLFWAVQCVLQQTKFQRWPKTGHKGKSPNWENAMKSHIWLHKWHLKSQNFRTTFFLLRSKDFLPTFTRCNFEETNLCLPQYYIKGHYRRDSAH